LAETVATRRTSADLGPGAIYECGVCGRNYTGLVSVHRTDGDGWCNIEATWACREHSTAEGDRPGKAVFEWTVEDGWIV
jgi:hypothetical protein